ACPCVCHGIGEGTGVKRRRDRSSSSCFGAARYRKTGGAGTHHLEARKTHSRRIREDEDSSYRGGGDSGAGSLPVSSCTHRASASREVGRKRLSQRARR